MKKQEKKTGLKEILKGGQETLPGFQFQIYRAEDKRSLWNADFEILFLLKGDGRVSYEDGVVYRVQEKDLFVVNGFQICSIDLNEQGILLSLKMSADAIASVHIEFLKYEIECRSFLFTEEQQEAFDVIRSDLARVFQEAYKNDMMQPVNARSRITALLEDLSRYFAAGERMKHSRSGRERIQMASDYILQHYKEAITLEDLADHIYLSRTYISRSFPRYFGVSFLEYITQVRLAHAILDMHGDATLTEIAYNNGFSNENVMIRAFRKYFGMTPGEYRKSIVQTAVREEEKNCGLIKYIDRTTEDYEKDNDVYRVLLQYAGFREQEFDAEKENSVQILAALGGRKQRIAGHWRRIINGGYARSVLDARVQEELAQAIRDIGYEFIRVKGILDDDMCVLRRDMKGEIRVGYQYIDAVLDFILSIGAKPMIEFGHMPGLLAEQPSQITMRPVQNAAPKDLEAWKRLIGGIMDHLRTRYGVERMSDCLRKQDVAIYLKIQGFPGKEKIEMSKENGYVLHLDISKFFSGWDAISGQQKENFRRALKAMDEYRSTADALEVLTGSDRLFKIIESESGDYAVRKERMEKLIDAIRSGADFSRCETLEAITATATTPVSFVQATFDNFARWEKEQIAKAYKVNPSEVNLKRTIPGTAVQRAEIPKMNLKIDFAVYVRMEDRTQGTLAVIKEY